jgi:BMFP domain-containing protein YqiC
VNSGSRALKQVADGDLKHKLRTTTVRSCTLACSITVHRGGVKRTIDAACYTAACSDSGKIIMLAPKAFLDALSGHASRLFNGETPLPRNEFETQFKALLHSAFSKLDMVSREEFDSQMAVLARTRARLEALEAKVAEMEEKISAPAGAESSSEPR